MTDLIKFRAKICLTASGMLLHNQQILLIKHRKLKRWFCPGGHIDAQELPHQAAEREFFEETGLRVKAVDYLFSGSSKQSQYLPSPIETNLHWVNRASYHARLKSSDKDKRVKTKLWPRGCEQHLNLVYLMAPDFEQAKFQHKNVKITQLKLEPNQQEVSDIGWFDLEQIGEIEVDPDMILQFRHGLELIEEFANQPFFSNK